MAGTRGVGGREEGDEITEVGIRQTMLSLQVQAMVKEFEIYDDHNGNPFEDF